MLDLYTLKSIRTMVQEKRDTETTTRESINFADTILSRLDIAIGKLPPDQERPPTVELVKTTKSYRKYHCTTCGISHTKYRIYFSKMHVKILRKIFAHCVRNKTHVIQKKDMDLTHSDYGNFYALRRFGFLYWQKDIDGRKKKGGNWGVAVSRIHDFLKGQWQVAEYAERDTARDSGENSQRRIYINQIPRYPTLSLEHNNYLPTFVEYQEVEPYFLGVAFNSDNL